SGNIRLLNVTHSAASFVQTDDLESFVRTQKGLRSNLSDWVDISRGLGDEEPDRELNATRGLATHELDVRAQYKACIGYMRDANYWMHRAWPPQALTARCLKSFCSMRQRSWTRGAFATGWRCLRRMAPIGCQLCQTRRTRSTRLLCSTTTAN